MNEQKTLWENVMVDIEDVVSKATFVTWFKNTFIVKQEEGTIFLSVPNTFVKDWLANKYHKTILEALRNKASDIRALEYVITKPDDKSKVEQEKVVIKDNQSSINLNNLYVSREDNLNPRYTFENFIVAAFNEVAHAAGQAVLNNLGTHYNPLFIYGGTGLGKTHLIQSIGNTVKKDGKKVYYITSESFTVDYVNSVQNNKAHLFKEKYRRYDLLIMDDVQFLSKKEKTQEELFHLFNSFHESNKQIIFSSDKPPKFIPDLEERLRSRFEGGMIADISKPEYETRLAILKSKAKESGFLPPQEVLEYMASMIQDNIRELEGALNSVVCQSQIKKRSLTLQEVKNLIKNNIKPQKSYTIKDVIKVVSDFYNIEERFLYDKTRRKEVVKPRQVAMYILREDFNTSYPYIGQKLGGRDHTTAIHAYEKIKNDLKENTSLQQEIENIRAILYNNG